MAVFLLGEKNIDKHIRLKALTMVKRQEAISSISNIVTVMYTAYLSSQKLRVLEQSILYWQL